MSITNYAELQAAVGNWLARGDLAPQIPDFIALAEQRIFYGSDDPNLPSPPLRIRAMEQTTDPAAYVTTPNVATLALPTGFLEARALWLATTPVRDLDFVTQKHLAAEWAGPAAGRPRVYSFTGDALRFGPTPDAAYGVSLSYYRKFDPLSVTPSNWILANAPGIYLYAALLEAQPFVMNDERLAVWAALYGAAARALTQADARDRFGGALAMCIAGATP
jgi:hypothetical protein